MGSTLEISSQMNVRCSWSATDKVISEENAPRQLKYRQKHLHKAQVWAGVSKTGASSLVMFQEIATRYGDILTASLIPFVHKAYPGAY